MRIGFITGEYTPLRGGLADFTHILGENLIAQGHKVFILSDNRTQTQNDNLPVTNTINKWRPPALPIIRQWVDDNTLDVVNLQYQTAAFNMSPFIHFLPDVLNIPFVTTFHDLRVPYLFPKAGFLRDWIVTHLASTSSGAIVTNAADYEQLKTLDNLELIRLGSNIALQLPEDYDRQQTRQSEGIADDVFLLGFFGLMNKTKGLDTLLDALRQVISEGVKAKLLIIGGDTGTADPTNAAYQQEIQRKIIDLSLGEHIMRTGYIRNADVSGYSKACDAIVLPFRDGVSYRRSSLMTMINHELPIITTTPQIPDKGLDDEYFLLVEPDNADALARAIHTLYQSPDTRQQLEQQVSQLKTEFAWDTIAQQTASFFGHVIGETLR